MMEPVPRTRSQRGFTLVELMMALVIFSFAIAGVLSVAVSSTRAFREQRRAVAVETATRAPMDFLVDAVRGASPGVNAAKIGLGDSCAQLTCATCFPTSGALMIKDNTNAPDELYVVYSAGGIVKTTYTDVVSSSTSVTLEDTSDFSPGDTVMFVGDGSLGTLRTVSAVPTGTTLTLSTPSPSSCANTNVWPTAGYPKGSLILRVTKATFTIGYLAGETNPPFLLMNGEPVAEGVEDMQVALGVDSNSDGGVTDSGNSTDEWIGNAASETIPGTYTLRAMKIVLVARDTTGLLGAASFARPAALNRAAGSADTYRRRELFSTVEVRNLTGSP
jgi:prepilin-type N-terminal cleavage/methylation domain-containing protein